MSTSIVSAVVDMLADRNPHAATRFARDYRPLGGDDYAEVRELNRYWREQLSRLRSSTVSARACLVDDVAPRDWLRHFRQLVLDTVVQNDLPTIH